MKKLLQIWRGAKTLGDWFSNGGDIVLLEKEMERASTCLKCPNNRRGSLLNWITRWMARRILRVLPWGRQWRMPGLYSCQICGCALVLKTKMPLTNIIFGETMEQLEKYPPNCWIAKELDQ